MNKAQLVKCAVVGAAVVLAATLASVSMRSAARAPSFRGSGSRTGNEPPIQGAHHHEYIVGLTRIAVHNASSRKLEGRPPKLERAQRAEDLAQVVRDEGFTLGQYLEKLGHEVTKGPARKDLGALTEQGDLVSVTRGKDTRWYAREHLPPARELFDLSDDFGKAQLRRHLAVLGHGRVSRAELAAIVNDADQALRQLEADPALVRAVPGQDEKWVVREGMEVHPTKPMIPPALRVSLLRERAAQQGGLISQQDALEALGHHVNRDAVQRALQEFEMVGGAGKGIYRDRAHAGGVTYVSAVEARRQLRARMAVNKRGEDTPFRLKDYARRAGLAETTARNELMADDNFIAVGGGPSSRWRLITGPERRAAKVGRTAAARRVLTLRALRPELRTEQDVRWYLAGPRGDGRFTLPQYADAVGAKLTRNQLKHSLSEDPSFSFVDGHWQLSAKGRQALGQRRTRAREASARKRILRRFFARHRVASTEELRVHLQAHAGEEITPSHAEIELRGEGSIEQIGPSHWRYVGR